MTVSQINKFLFKIDYRPTQSFSELYSIIKKELKICELLGTYDTLHHELMFKNIYNNNKT